MSYIPKYQEGRCCKEGCGVKLPIPTWRYCHIHSAKNTISKTPVNKLRSPDDAVQPIDRSYNKKIPQIVLDPKKYKPFKSYMGYELKIPFFYFIRSKEIIFDNDKWEIIGWK